MERVPKTRNFAFYTFKQSNMKHVSSFVVFCLLSSLVFAQSNKEDVDIVQAMFGKQKKN